MSAVERLDDQDVLIALPRDVTNQPGEPIAAGACVRIATARAILRNAALLLLDEAASSLDTESETLAGGARRADAPALAIAHRLATVLSCDRILVIDQGRIVEQGTHAELVAETGHTPGLRGRCSGTPDVIASGAFWSH